MHLTLSCLPEEQEAVSIVSSLERAACKRAALRQIAIKCCRGKRRAYN